MTDSSNILFTTSLVDNESTIVHPYQVRLSLGLLTNMVLCLTSATDVPRAKGRLSYTNIYLDQTL